MQQQNYHDNLALLMEWYRNNKGTIFGIIQHTMVRFMVLFFLFLLEYLFIWLVDISRFLMNPIMIQFLQQWTIRLFVIVSICIHIWVYEENYIFVTISENTCGIKCNVIVWMKAETSAK